VFRVVVMLVLALHVFCMYGMARANAETFGFSLGTTVVAAMFGLVMLVPLVWAVTLPELPEIYVTHVRGRRWWRSGRCPSCGYRTDGLIDAICPECGEAIAEPAGYRINARTVRRFVAISLMAWVVGCAAGEVWIGLDEIAFRRESRDGIPLRGSNIYFRDARWPMHGVMIGDRDGEFWRARGIIIDR
jgi:hypothetical protein